MKVTLVSIICSINVLFAQSQTIGLSIPKLNAPLPHLTTFLLKKMVQKTDNQQVANVTPRPIPLVFCAETLPFFCKIEHKMGLNQKLPLKFRLGDVQYVDELEGKRKSN